MLKEIYYLSRLLILHQKYREYQCANITFNSFDHQIQKLLHVLLGLSLVGIQTVLHAQVLEEVISIIGFKALVVASIIPKKSRHY